MSVVSTIQDNPKPRRYCWREARFLPGCEACGDREGSQLAQQVTCLIEVINQRCLDPDIIEASNAVAVFLDERYPL